MVVVVAAVYACVCARACVRGVRVWCVCMQRNEERRCTKSLDPRSKIETVFPGFFTPVIFTTEPRPRLTDSHDSANPSLSLLKESTSATGLHPSVCTSNKRTLRTVGTF